MAKAHIGIHVGRAEITAVAFDCDENVLSSASAPVPTRYLPGGGAEHEADELWLVSATVLRSVTDELRPAGHHPVAVAVASVGGSGVLLNRRGQPLLPVMAWFDQRTEPQTGWWMLNVGVERTQRIACLPPRPVFGATKMLWSKTNASTRWSVGHRWLNIADWIAYRLSGEMATDHSLASRTMLFDLVERRWSDELLDAADLRSSLMAPLVESGHRIGTVSSEAAAVSGLPIGTVVGAGGLDHLCAALSVGVTEPGMMLDSPEGGDAFFLVTRNVDTSGVLAGAGIGQGAHVVQGRTYAMTGLQTGSARVSDRRLAMGLDWEAFSKAPDSACVIDQLAGGRPARVRTVPDRSGAEPASAEDIRSLAARLAETEGGNVGLIEQTMSARSRPVTVVAPTHGAALGAARLARQAAF